MRTIKKPYMKTSVSLFSGIGGLDEGLHRAGFTPLFCCEVDPFAHRSLQNWCKLRNVTPLLATDVTDVDPEGLLEALNLKRGELDLLAGGPPCQSFSLIGTRGSLGDARGALLLQMIRFAKVLQPKTILIEQVKGLLSAKDEEGKRGGVLNRVLNEIEKLGYQVSYKVLRAADYGVPQLRDRVFIVATQVGTNFVFPEPTHAPQKMVKSATDLFFSSLKPYINLRESICDLPAPCLKGETPLVSGHVDITPQRDIERITGVPEGECLAKQLHLPAEQRMRLNPEKDTTKFRRLSWDQPALTLRGGEAFYHPVFNRYLTPREYMRLHGFDDAHTLEGPIRARSGSAKGLDQHRQVANAVPPKLAEVIGEAIVKQCLPSKGKKAA